MKLFESRQIGKLSEASILNSIGILKQDEKTAIKILSGRGIPAKAIGKNIKGFEVYDVRSGNNVVLALTLLQKAGIKVLDTERLSESISGGFKSAIKDYENSLKSLVSAKTDKLKAMQSLEPLIPKLDSEISKYCQENGYAYYTNEFIKDLFNSWGGFHFDISTSPKKAPEEIKAFLEPLLDKVSMIKGLKADINQPSRNMYRLHISF